MRKAFTVVMIAIASVPAAALVGLGLIVLDLMRVAANRANRGTFERTPITRKDREDFEAALQESEFAVVNRGPRVN